MAAKVGYRPAYAQEQARARRWTGSRLEREAICATSFSIASSAAGRPSKSPAGSSGRRVPRTISHESIYRFIYAQIRRTNEGAWRRYLPRAKFKRGWRARKGRPPARLIKGRVSITERPKTARYRRSPGIGKPTSCSSPPTAKPSSSRTSASPASSSWQSNQAKPHSQPSKSSAPGSSPSTRNSARQSPSTTEASSLSTTASNKLLGIQTFFCDTHSPWQKAGIENAIGRMRRPLPRKTDPRHLDPETLTAFVAAYNNTPRKCLDFKSPAQAFLAQLLHFKCESTIRFSPE